jgi:hypothetical protein
MPKVFDIPNFATSNETWSNEALNAARACRVGSSAVLVGQAHATSVLPHIQAPIEKIVFADVAYGHDKVFEAKMKALEAVPEDIADAYEYLERLKISFGKWFGPLSERDLVRLATETSMHFDYTRLNHPQGVDRNPRRKMELLEKYAPSKGNLEIAQRIVDLSYPPLAAALDDVRDIAWLHLSNLAELTRDTSLSAKVIQFAQRLKGIGGDTLVTYAIHDLEAHGSWWPSVHASTIEDLDLDRLLQAHENVPCLKNK